MARCRQHPDAKREHDVSQAVDQELPVIRAGNGVLSDGHSHKELTTGARLEAIDPIGRT